MAAVIRMKRRVDEEPLNAFVLNCKKQKTDGQPISEAAQGSSNETSTTLKFAGTISNADSISSHLTKLNKEEAKEIISKTHRPNITSKNREQSRQNAHSSRFKIVNCSRSLGDVDENQNLTIVDVEKDTKTPKAEEETDKFVYDLYVADESESRMPYPENLDDLSVEAIENPLYFDHRGLNGFDSEDGDSEDSNDENNWRNEYPDEDDDCYRDDESIDEDDMRRAVENIDLEGDRELSSDDEELNEYDDNTANSDDINRYGRAYARYKSRIMKELNQPSATIKEYNSDDPDEDNEGIQENSEDSDDKSSEENFDLYD